MSKERIASTLTLQAAAASVGVIIDDDRVFGFPGLFCERWEEIAESDAAQEPPLRELVRSMRGEREFLTEREVFELFGVGPRITVKGDKDYPLLGTVIPLPSRDYDARVVGPTALHQPPRHDAEYHTPCERVPKGTPSDPKPEELWDSFDVHCADGEIISVEMYNTGRKVNVYEAGYATTSPIQDAPDVVTLMTPRCTKDECRRVRARLRAWYQYTGENSWSCR